MDQQASMVLTNRPALTFPALTFPALTFPALIFKVQW